ncbi:MAG: helix-turn-helix domain-containing protein [Terriglobales bacterium]
MLTNTDTHYAAPLPLLSLCSAARRLGLSVWTLRAWAARGRIATVEIGSRVLVSEGELQRIVAEGTRPRRQPQPETVLAMPRCPEVAE